MDELRAFTRLEEEELRLCARLYAKKLNRARNKVKVVIPLKGFSAIDAPGTPLYAPEEDKVLIEELKNQVTNDKVEFVEVNANLEEREFAKN